MSGIKWNLLLLATLGVFSIIGMGISIGANSYTGMIVCFILFVAIMGYGFKTKKKMRDNGEI
ncbi:YlaF family protein [Bacillus sp. FJAT-49711]|uniref:YlaF family protein n=1 Tax=Bacillus sp. FJAT-49711 TaxID=2833585 RepID=UPI001BC8D323|nr:YlaF family protein [Bacillus sp. FJAT-49711]MBS4217891.1 YlaF family protein [Bacillus sp. FJAT-49711]